MGSRSRATLSLSLSSCVYIFIVHSGSGGGGGSERACCTFRNEPQKWRQLERRCCCCCYSRGTVRPVLMLLRGSSSFLFRFISRESMYIYVRGSRQPLFDGFSCRCGSVYIVTGEWKSKRKIKKKICCYVPDFALAFNCPLS